MGSSVSRLRHRKAAEGDSVSRVACHPPTASSAQPRLPEFRSPPAKLLTASCPNLRRHRAMERQLSREVRVKSHSSKAFRHRTASLLPDAPDVLGCRTVTRSAVRKASRAPKSPPLLDTPEASTQQRKISEALDLAAGSKAPSKPSRLLRTAVACDRGCLLKPGGLHSVPLLGGEELEAVLPGGQAKLFVGSWNLAGELPELESLAKWLRPAKVEAALGGADEEADVYALGVQEGPAFDSGFWREWEALVCEALGPAFVCLATHRLGVLVLSVFVRRSLVWFLSLPEKAALPSSSRANPLPYFSKTKGAVALAFSLFATSFLFVNAHFVYGPERNKKRAKNYRRMVAKLKPKRHRSSSSSSSSESEGEEEDKENKQKMERFEVKLGKVEEKLEVQLEKKKGKKALEKVPSIAESLVGADATSDLTEEYDRVFWFGDLNFSTEGGRAVVEWLARTPIRKSSRHFDFSRLLQRDLLRKEMKAGRIFAGFSEAEISFPPTYKYDIGTSHFDSSAKARVPAYTDRVLFRANSFGLPSQGIQSLAYTSVPELEVSDHKPVAGLFRVAVSSGRPDRPAPPAARCSVCEAPLALDAELALGEKRREQKACVVS